MDLRSITDKQKTQYDKLATHLIQSWQWGEFRKSLQTSLFRFGIYQNNKLTTVFQFTLHKIPFTKFYVGYLPKGPSPDKNLADALEKIAKEKRCAFFKIEPNVSIEDKSYILDTRFKKSPKSLFTKHNFILDLTKSEEILLKYMHPKTRYNIRLAEKKGVKVEERTDDEAFEIYLKLYFETTKRQSYFGHNEKYHQKVWEIFKKAKLARLLIGFCNNKPLSAWMLINFKDTLYYPYGGSSTEHKEVMANNLVAWHAIKLGKKLKLKTFDMWGTAGPNPSPADPYYGFHRFKQGYNPELTEYIGTFDLIFNYPLYHFFNFFDKNIKLKAMLLKFLR